MMFWMKIMHA